MPEAPRQRPEKHAVLHTFAAHIGADATAVFDAVDARLSQGAATNVYYYLADSQSLLIVVQGGWWYRAEYRVEPDDRGSTLEHVVVNIAQRGDKAALIAGRRVIDSAPIAFHELVKSLRAEFG